MPANKVTFVTREYRLSHAREPRGRGSWAFTPNPALDSASPEIIWSARHSTYTEARRAAAAVARDRRISTLYVMP